jgi:hypothetical protein
MTEKPRAKTPGAPAPSREAGQLVTDDLGNITWEWKNEGDLLADDELGDAERIRALVDPSLQVEVEDGPPSPTGINATGLRTGYNPYNSGALHKEGYKKTKNLKELSKWIELRKNMAAKKGQR